MSDSFTHRFSTKPWCPVTGLSEYELRKYRPDIGRFASRDPLGELSYGNPYRFSLNSPLSVFDLLGLLTESEKEIIKQEEGFRDKVYKDTMGKRTIGYGFNLDRDGAQKAIAALGLNYEDLVAGKAFLSVKNASKLFDIDAMTADRDAAIALGSDCWNNMKECVKDILAHMAYQMGGAGIRKFPKMISALCNNSECPDYAKAADEMLNSIWAKEQTPNRAKRLADRMRNAKKCH